MKRLVFITDPHIGLKTDDMDRTTEIIDVLLFAAKRARKVKADVVVFGGDIFDHNNPNDYLIGQFIRVLNVLRKANIMVYVMVGNHDAIAKHRRRSCLSFIKKIKGGYPNIKLIDDIISFRIWKAEVGDVHFTFLPFVAKAHLKPAYRSVQHYVDTQAKRINRELPKDAQHFVFSHLNVPECQPGTEEFMLKKVETVLPEAFLKMDLSKRRPYPVIIQGHIHSRQVVGNVNIVGSPVFVTFGEKEKAKYFLQVDIPERLGEGSGDMKFIKTPCRPFIELNLEFNTPEISPLDTKSIKKQIRNITPTSILKVNVTVREEHMKPPEFWESARQDFMKVVHYCKPIRPRILRTRVKRNQKQTTKLSPADAIRVWLKSNKPKNRKRLRKLANQYIEGEL